MLIPLTAGSDHVYTAPEGITFPPIPFAGVTRKISPEQISAEMSEIMISEPTSTVTVNGLPTQSPLSEVGVTVYSM